MGILSLFADSVRETFTGGWSEEELISAINRTFLDHRKNNPALLGELSVCLSRSLFFLELASRFGLLVFLHRPLSASSSFSFCVCVCYLYLFSNTLASNVVLSVNSVAVCMYQSYTRRSRNHKEAQPIRIQSRLVMSLVCLLLLTLISLPQSLSLFLPNKLGIFCGAG